MKIFTVPLDIKLGEDALLDLFIVQWHTPVPTRGHAPSQISDEEAQKKRQVLQQFRDWLPQQTFEGFARPVFIIIPELSMPKSGVSILEELVQAMQRPIIVIAGLEYYKWVEYQQLIQGSPAMPDPQSWLMGGEPAQWVNLALILIRDESGQITRFVQTKRLPQADEQAIPLYQGRNILVFRSKTQASGVRLNFLVQICSDFTNAASVRELRKEVGMVCEGLKIDFTILLQMNEDQEAEQFKDSVREYFEPPDRLIETEDGSLLFVNNASEAHGSFDCWGDSRFHFAYRHKWPKPEFVSPTYWMREDGPHNYQAVAFRERGPGIYWVKYKPHYLVRTIPGSPQMVPFSENFAKYAPIADNGLNIAADTITFSTIPAVCHWLFSEWNEGCHGLKKTFEENQIRKQVASKCLTSYTNGIKEWREAIANRDSSARSAMCVYFSCWENIARSKFPATEKEPLEWCPEVRKGVRQMMATYSLLKLGVHGFPNHHLKCFPENVGHGISNDNLGVTLMWGGSRFNPLTMTNYYLATRKSYGVTDLLYDMVLLVFIQPSGTTNAADLGASFNNDDDVTKGQPIPGFESNGDVVVVRPPVLRWLYADDLLGTIPHALTSASLSSTLAGVIQTALV